MPEVPVVVDDARCVGSMTCVGLAPHLFEMVDGVASPVRRLLPDDLDLRDAEDGCPVTAIRVDRSPADEPPVDNQTNVC